MLNISKVSGPEELSNARLRSRAERLKSGWMSEYIVARIESPEAALLILDHFPSTVTAAIQEIFVLEPYREQGIGTAMLKYAEARAVGLGCGKIQLEVYPLDVSVHKELLRAWYARHGYQPDEGNLDKMHKFLADPHPRGMRQ